MSLRDEANLQERVTLYCDSVPLVDAFKRLTGDRLIRVVLPENLKPQRVSIRVADTPLWSVFDRLCLLLSHGTTKPSPYYWVRDDESDVKAVVYRLTAAPLARAMEQQEREKPERQAMDTLKRWRSTDADAFFSAAALKGLNDTQLQDLMQGQAITRPVTPELYAAKKQEYDALSQRFREQGDPRTFPPFDLPVKEVTLCVIPYKSNVLAPPEASPVYLLSVQSGKVAPTRVVTDGTHLNGGLSRDEAKAVLLPDDKETSPVLDLEPLLTAPGVTDAQRGSVSYVLSVIAKAAGLDGYAEIFFNRALVGGGVGRPANPVLSHYKGTVAQLVNEICQGKDLAARRDGTSLLVWSRTWALDRRVDVPESFLAPWRKTLATRDATEEDYIAVASRLSCRQMYLTLPYALPKFQVVQESDYRDMLLASALNAQELSAARQEGGVPVLRLAPETQQIIKTQYFGITPPFQMATRPVLPEDGLRRVFLSCLGAPSTPSTEYRTHFSVTVAPDGTHETETLKSH